MKVANLLPVFASIALKAIDRTLCSANVGLGVAQRRLQGAKVPDKIILLDRELLQGGVLLFPLALGLGNPLRRGKRAVLQILDAAPKGRSSGAAAHVSMLRAGRR
jgi:hypothetical protein